jgi:hypothetical protein
MGIDKDKEVPFIKGCTVIPRSSYAQTLFRIYESSFCPNIFLIPFSRGSSMCVSNQLSLSGFGGGGGGGGGVTGCGVTGRGDTGRGVADGCGGGEGGTTFVCDGTGCRLSGSDSVGIWSTCPGLMRLGSFPITCLFAS